MIKILTLLCYFITLNESKRILGVFPTPSISHQIVFRPLMHELAKRGHEVTVITPDPVYPKGKVPQNLTEIDVHDASYKIWRKFVEAGKGNSDDLAEQIKLGFILLAKVFEVQVNTPEVKMLLSDKNKKFDLIFTESCVRPAISFSYVYDAPIIEFSSLAGLTGVYEDMGAASNPLIYPYPFLRKVFNMTIWEKFMQLKLYFSYLQLYDELEIKENELLKTLFGPATPTLSELRKNVHMVFLNVHPIWDQNRPVPPNIIYLGGMHQNKPKDLPKDLQSYLDSSRNGLIYMSFGTNVKSSLLPSDKMKIFTKVFSQLPYNILWKWDEDDFPDCPKNVKIAKWFPQSALLKHPNVKLFITQGGLQSTDEAIAAGIPLIGVPMLVDQWFNTQQYAKQKIGIQLNFETLTEEELINSINSVINDPSYRENARKLHAIIVDQPLSPLERAVWWTEHVLRHGGALHLQAQGAHMHWVEYYEVKLLISLSIILVCTFLLLSSVTYFVYKSLIFHVKVKIN